MKKLTTETSIFGPYDSIETLSDRYVVNGCAELHFSVIGEGIISDWVGPMPVYIPEVIITVPVSVKMRQARLVLNSSGYLESVEANISLLSKADQIEWEFAETVLRDSPLVQKISTLLNISETQVDDLFILAGTL